ncbi:hypothetical protein BD413DRAFT_531139 [Trametes elegans]|nr:hypothetical protein BD413DRAFT_531139 [Trametes elegans]
MTIANDTPIHATGERDLTIHQRGLVETCFEENQYEAAIAVLDEVRSSKNKPFPPHIRQLIYMALYPPPSIEEDLEEETTKAEPGSPSKALSRRHKTSQVPSPKSSAAARDVLMKYARTNTPKSLALALPDYSVDLHANTFAVEDSWIAREAQRIQKARCCWEIIKEGFIRRNGGEAMSSPRKARARRSTRRAAGNDDGWEADSTEPPAPVSEHAWGVLDWLLTLFEHDEAGVEQTGQARYSPLLLEQIPPSRAERAPRWDVELPLDVAFYALEQDSETRRSLGVRLLALLINLGSTTLLDFPMFLNATSTRVSGLPLETLSYLLSALPVTHTAAQFKVRLCRHALGGGTAAASSKALPQPRARPAPRRRVRAEAADASADADAVPASQQDSSAGAGAHDPKAGGAVSVARKLPAITAPEVVDLLSRPSMSEPAAVAQALCFKGELVATYGFLQMQATGDAKDAKWAELLADGSLRTAVEETFGSGAIESVADAEERDYVQQRRDALLAIMSVWQP